MDDRQIIDLLWARSDHGILHMASKYNPYCIYIARNILGSQEDSEECLNDVLLKAWDLIPPARPENLGTFLGKLTRNLALDRYRRNTAMKRGGSQVNAVLEELEGCLPAAGTTEEQMLHSIDISRILTEFLDEQKKVSRIIFVKRYWYLTPVKEIADELGFSQSRVKMSLSRTRKALAERLQKEGFSI